MNLSMVQIVLAWILCVFAGKSSVCVCVQFVCVNLRVLIFQPSRLRFLNLLQQRSVRKCLNKVQLEVFFRDSTQTFLKRDSPAVSTSLNPIPATSTI